MYQNCIKIVFISSTLGMQNVNDASSRLENKQNIGWDILVKNKVIGLFHHVNRARVSTQDSLGTIQVTFLKYNLFPFSDYSNNFMR